MDKETTALLKKWRVNPFHHFTREDIRAIFNVGEKSMRALVAMGAPLVADKINPDHFKAWLWENRESIGKLTE